jgi:hypothetical protein
MKSPRRWLLYGATAALAFVLARAVAARRPGEQHGETPAPSVAKSRPQAPAGAAEAAIAAEVLSRAARAPRLPTFVTPSHGLTRLQELAIRYHSVRELQQSLVSRIADVARMCPAGNGAPTRLRVVFEAALDGKTARLTRPTLEVAEGAPLSDRYRECLLGNLAPIQIEASGDSTYPPYAGDLDMYLNVGA